MALVTYLKDMLAPGSYLFWLLLASLFCFFLERLRPWRAGQSWRRPQLLQDVFFLLFNGHIFGLLLALVLGSGFRQFCRGYGWCLFNPEVFPNFLAGWPVWGQVAIFLVVKDFLEYVVHNLLHRVRPLWVVHRLHHSIETMDWIGNFRFHWMEIIVYDTLKWLPLVFLKADPKVILAVGVASTVVGHLNHANVRLDWGPLRYILNSPRMHIWHHDYVCRYKAGQNFAVVFSLWDWIFGTAYFPYEEEGPDRLGFHGIEDFPKSMAKRLVYPLASRGR